jgi:hypothetical protein
MREQANPLFVRGNLTLRRDAATTVLTGIALRGCLKKKWSKAGIDLRAVRENERRRADHEPIFKLSMLEFIRCAFAGPLRRTVPAIFQTAPET